MKKVFFVLLLSITQFTFAAADNKSEQSKQDLVKQVAGQTNGLLEAGALLAAERLKKEKGFSPFAYILNDKNSLLLLEADGPLKGRLDVRSNIEYLRGQIMESVHVAKAAGSEVVAAAIFSDSVAKMTSGKDQKGVAVEFEHSSGISTIQFVPYNLSDKGVPVMGESVTKLKPALFFKPKAEIDSDVKALKQEQIKESQKDNNKK